MRRDHLYRGLKKQDYHEYYDRVYNMMVEQVFLNNICDDDHSHSDEGSDEGEEHHHHEETAIFSNKWTITSNNIFYLMFKIMKIIASFYLCLFYPTLSHKGIR